MDFKGGAEKNTQSPQSSPHYDSFKRAEEPASADGYKPLYIPADTGNIEKYIELRDDLILLYINRSVEC